MQIANKCGNISEKWQQRMSSICKAHIILDSHPIIQKGKEQLSFQACYIYIKVTTKSSKILSIKRARSICWSRWSSLAAMWQQQQLLAMCSSSEWAGVRVSVEGWTQARKEGAVGPPEKTVPKTQFRGVSVRPPSSPVVTKSFLGKEPVKSCAQFPEQLIQCETS